MGGMSRREVPLAKIDEREPRARARSRRLGSKIRNTRKIRQGCDIWLDEDQKKIVEREINV